MTYCSGRIKRPDLLRRTLNSEMTHIREAVFPALNLPRKGKRAAVPMELDRSMELEYDSIFEYSNIPLRVTGRVH